MGEALSAMPTGTQIEILSNQNINTIKSPPRSLPIDALRGLLIIVMALDHANQFIAHGKREPELWIGQFPEYHGDVLAFLTRFVTHLAAPGFFFIMGTGMVLFTASRSELGWKRHRIWSHFLARGALLILLQFLLENPAWNILDIFGPTIYFGVLFALGSSMILGALLLYLPSQWLMAISTALIVSTELLLPDSTSATFQYPYLQRLLSLPGYTQGIYVLYPILPWLGVVGMGIAYGRWFQRDQERAYRDVLWLGAACWLAFIPIRLLDGFGNIRPMAGKDWIAFFNLVKYPPSLTFLLWTLGTNFLLLSILARFSKRANVFRELLAVFGRVPLFFYLAHLYLYALIGQLIAPQGIGVARMFPFWLLGLFLLYPLCRRFGQFKHAQPIDSLWRFV